MEQFDVAIVGAGVVGTATGAGFHTLGKRVLFVDTNERRLADLGQRGFVIHPVDEPLDAQARFIFVCVNTPYGVDAIDLNYVKASMASVGALIAAQREPPVVIIRSTVLPGTTEKILAPLLAQHSDRKLNEGFFLAYNPEFLRAASSEEDFLHPRAIVLGLVQDDAALRGRLTELFRPIDSEIHFMSIMESEFVKYLNNLRNSTLISFANEMWLMGNHLGLDTNRCLSVITVVSETIWNPKYGSTGGAPYGGTCFPKDTKSMRAFARKERVPMPLLDAVIEVNEKLEQLAQQGKAQPAQIRSMNWMPAPRRRAP